MLRNISATSFSRFLSWLVTSLLCCLIAACGGGGGGGVGSQPGDPNAVTLALVASATDSFGGGATVKVDAQVLNSSAVVQWQLTGVGSLSSASGASVTYTPPEAVSVDSTVTIQATLPDKTTPLTRTVVVNVHASIVNASASAAQVFTDQLSGVLFSAAPLFTNDPVSWSLNGGPGILSPTSGPSVTYTPDPNLTSITPVTITATVGGVSQNLTLKVVPAAFKTLIASAAQAFAGGAAVTLNANAALVSGPLTWSLSGAGTLTPNGLSASYTPPASLTADTIVTITATDGTNPQTFDLLVHPAPSLSVSAGASFAVVGGSSVTLTAIQQFTTATVTWSLLPTDPGTLSATSGNLVNYVPPATGILPNTTTVTITASAGTLTQTLILPLHSALGNHWTSALPPGVSYRAIVNSGVGGKFVAVGDSGTIFTSVDGITWTSAVSGTAQNLNGISFGTVAGIGTFIVVGDSGTILTSTDGNTWTPAATVLPTSQFLQSVSFGNGTFVAVGTEQVNGTGSILTSTDGNTWTSATAPTAQSLVGITFANVANGKFAAVGVDLSFSGMILTSADGITWAAPTTPLATPPAFFGISHGIVNAIDTFVAVGQDVTNGSGSILTSADGNTWTPATVPANVQFLVGVSHDGIGKFAAVGLDAVTGSGTIVTSADGNIWTSDPTVPANAPLLLGVSFGAGKFVAVGGSGTILASDTTGSNWTTVTAGTALNLFGVGSDGVLTFVAVGQSGTILNSINGGINWAAATVTPATAQDLVGVSFGNAKFVAVGGGTILTSDATGSNWTPAAVIPATATNLLGVSFGNGQFVAVGVDVGGAAMIITSADGNSWTTATVPVTGQFLLGVSFGNGKFVAVGTANTILTSLDGISWTPATVPVTAQDLLGVSFGNGSFVAVGSVGTIFISTDGISWFGANVPANTQNLLGVSFGVAVGVSGTILTSADEITWITAVPATVQNLSGVTFGNGQYAAVGASGTILMSNH